MKFTDFSQALEQLEQTSSRLTMTEQLAQLYAKFSPAEIEPATYLMQGRLVPEYQSLEFNLSTKMILRALATFLSRHQADNSSTTISTNLFGEDDHQHLEEAVKTKFQAVGDLGLTVEHYRHQIDANQGGDLELIAVFNSLVDLAQDEGQGSQERKVMTLVKLWETVSPLSARYITRIIMGKVRLGFSTMTLLDSLSWLTQGDKSQRDKLEEAYNKQADVGKLATSYLAAKDNSARDRVLENYSVQNGVPVVPALAQRLNSTPEVIQKMGQVYVEPKYDGLRIQVHYKKGHPPTAYTRSLDVVTHMFPELSQLESEINVQSCILDGEAIGIDPKSGALVDFQLTVTRKRKHGVESQAAAVPIKFFIFDILEKDGQPLIDLPLSERKSLLSQILPHQKVFSAVEYIESSSADEIKQYHQSQLDKGLEGAIFKRVDSKYRGGRKGWRWVKMKEAEGETGKLSDTLDVIVMGYYLGKGKRSQFGIGAILVGVRDEKTDEIKTLTKIGTGLTDDQFREMKTRADELAIKQRPSNYMVNKNLVPDIWIQPGLVIEVAADEITTSSAHAAGVALRFPRLISFRDDKDWQSATTLDELKSIN